jgi:lipid-binding SYLF domain-containing protein
MKKLLLLSLIALVATASVRADDAHTPRPELVVRVETCEAILREFMADATTAVPPSVWRAAHGIIILNQFKAGLLFGVKAGYGIIMVKKPNGHWSLPVLIDASEASLGLQIGAKSVETLCILTDDLTARMLYTSRYNIGVDAKAVAGPNAAEVERDSKPIFMAPVLVYSHSTVKAGHISRNDLANFTLYATDHTMPELLFSDWVTPPPEVQPLINYVEQLAP